MADAPYKNLPTVTAGAVSRVPDVASLPVNAVEGDERFVDSQSGIYTYDGTQWNAEAGIPLSQKGAANGVATLDGGGKVPVSQLPSTIMNYRGAWNASTNSPTLADGTGADGDVYRASVAGTQNLGSGSQTWSIGDFVIYNGAIWQHSPAADGVSSVQGFTGAVVLATSDVVTTSSITNTMLQGTIPVAKGGTGTTTSTGAGSVVLSTSPTLVTPALGTPSAVVLTNATGLSLTAGITGVLPTANGGTGSSASVTYPASGTVMTREANETVTGNKTLTGLVSVVDVQTTFINNADSSKIGRFNFSNLSAATTRIYNFPDVNADMFAMLAATQTLTNKTIDGASNSISVRLQSDVTGTLPVSNGGTGVTSATGTTSVVLSNAPTITGGTFTSTNTLSLLDTSAAFTVQLIAASSVALPHNVSLNLDLVGGTRTFSLAGNFATVGTNSVTLTTTGATNVTLPTTGTLATLAGTETFTNKTLSSTTNVYRSIGQAQSGVDASSGQRLGTNTNDSASAGNIGEYPTLSVNSSSVTGSVTAGTYTDAGVSVTLSAGDWDVEGWCTIQLATSAGTGAVGIIAVADLTDSSNVSQQKALNGFCNSTVAMAYAQTYVKARITVASGTPVYKLRFSSVNNSGTPTVTGVNLVAGGSAPHSLLRARRVR